MKKNEKLSIIAQTQTHIVVLVELLIHKEFELGVLAGMNYKDIKIEDVQEACFLAIRDGCNAIDKVVMSEDENTD